MIDFDLLPYLIPPALALFIVWFFYPSIAGKRETKISREEYVWFTLCIVFIPLFIFDLVLAFWYVLPHRLDDVSALLIIFIPWLIISGAGTVYGIRTISRLRKKPHTPDTEGNHDETT